MRGERGPPGKKRVGDDRENLVMAAVGGRTFPPCHLPAAAAGPSIDILILQRGTRERERREEAPNSASGL